MPPESSMDDPGYDVSECECGHLAVRIGRVRVELTREEFLQLHRAVRAAAARLGTASAHPGVRSNQMH